MTSVIIEVEFSSAHFYHQPLWSLEKNREVFGRCFTKFGHGHNYTLRAEVRILEKSNIVKIREQILKVISKIDHEHLNFVIPEFAEKIPTSEVILDYLRNGISGLVQEKILNMELFETANIGARLV